jgi:predicted RNA-binding Zn ribbon-like protein
MSWSGLTGEPLALDLVNTVVGAAGGHVDTDLLSSAEALQDWLTAEGERLSASARDSAAEVDLPALHDLRTAISEAVAAAMEGRPPSERALAAITDAQRAAPAYRALTWDGNAVVATVRRTGDASANLLAEIAEAAAELLADPSSARIRRCQGPNCRMLFLPANPRRRWCSPAICGNRVRVARYYESHKD